MCRQEHACPRRLNSTSNSRKGDDCKDTPLGGRHGGTNHKTTKKLMLEIARFPTYGESKDHAECLFDCIRLESQFLLPSHCSGSVPEMSARISSK